MLPQVHSLHSPSLSFFLFVKMEEMTTVEIKWDISFERMKWNVEAFGIILKTWKVGTYFTNNVPFFFFFSFPSCSQTVKDIYQIPPCLFPKLNFLKLLLICHCFQTLSHISHISHTDHNSSLRWDIPVISLSCPSRCSSLCCHQLCCLCQKPLTMGTTTDAPEPNKGHSSMTQWEERSYSHVVDYLPQVQRCVA